MKILYAIIALSIFVLYVYPHMIAMCLTFIVFCGLIILRESRIPKFLRDNRKLYWLRSIFF